MRNYILNGLVLTVLFLSGCKTNLKNSHTRDTVPVVSISGKAFLQPIDKKLSLAFAPNTYIILNFLDNSFCNVEIRGLDNVVGARKYILDSAGNFVLRNPNNDHIRKYKFISMNGESYLLDGNDTKLYKVLSSDTLNRYFLTQNPLKIKAFLYPSLDEKEQEYGAEDRYVQEGNRMISIPHPLRSEVSKINIYDLF